MRQMTRLVPMLALGAVTLLSACADSTSAAPPRPASGAPVVAGPAGAASTRFDGRYSGPAVLTLQRSSVCGPTQQTRSLTVINGVLRYVVDPYRNVVVTGSVQPEGTVNASSDTDLTSRVSGRFRDGTFTGEWNSSACTRSLNLRRPARR